MRKTLVLGTTLILLQIPLLAYVLQQERTWGGPERDGAQGVAASGDVVWVTGSTRSFGAGGDDAFLLKYGLTGPPLQLTYGTAPDELNAGEESGIDVAIAADGGPVVLGNYRDGNIFLAKFDAAGNLMWDRTWGGGQEGAGAIAIHPTDGTIYVTGITFGFGAGQGDAFLLSFTNTGTLNWQRTWGGEFFDNGHDVTVATDGNIYITGDTIFTANSAFLVKFAPNGSLLQDIEWGVVGKTGVPGETQGHGVAAAPAGGAYVVGATLGAGFDPNLVVVRFDNTGNFVWQRVGGPGFGNAQDVAVDSVGNVHVTGNVLTDPINIGPNAFVWSLQANGKALAAALWGGDDPFEPEIGASIAAHPNGTIFVAGTTGQSPYAFGRGSRNARTASTFIADISGTVTQPAGAVGIPVAVVTVVAGSETFAGVSDAFLLRLQQ